VLGLSGTGDPSLTQQSHRFLVRIAVLAKVPGRRSVPLPGVILAACLGQHGSGRVEMDPRMLQVLLASGAGFTALFFWLHDLRARLLAVADRALEAVAAAPHPAAPRSGADPATASPRTSN